MTQHRLVLSVLLSVITVGCHDATTKVAPSERAREPVPAEAPTHSDVGRVKLETTLGDIVIRLAIDDAPSAALRFLRNAEDGVYDGTIFHRVLKDSMIQGGGYTAEFEPKQASTHSDIPDRWQNELSNKRGTIALIRSAQGAGVPTAQFFINVSDNLQLDGPEYRGTFAVFGWVIEGMDTVDAIANTPVDGHPKYAGGKSAVVPTEPIVIKSVLLLDALDEAKLREAAGEALAAVEQMSIDDVAAKVASESGRTLVTTDSGLRYVDIVEGTGMSPLETDTIEFNYRGTLIDGTVFESTFETEPAVRELGALIPGLTEGIMSMKEHGQRKLILPPGLAFGENGIPGRIPPESILIFEIELLTVR